MSVFSKAKFIMQNAQKTFETSTYDSFSSTTQLPVIHLQNQNSCFQLIAIDRSPLAAPQPQPKSIVIGSKTSFDRYCLQIAKLHPAAAAGSKQKCIKHLGRFEPPPP